MKNNEKWVVLAMPEKALNALIEAVDPGLDGDEESGVDCLVTSPRQRGVSKALALKCVKMASEENK